MTPHRSSSRSSRRPRRPLLIALSIVLSAAFVGSATVLVTHAVRAERARQQHVRVVAADLSADLASRLSSIGLSGVTLSADAAYASTLAVLNGFDTDLVADPSTLQRWAAANDALRRALRDAAAAKDATPGELVGASREIAAAADSATRAAHDVVASAAQHAGAAPFPSHAGTQLAAACRSSVEALSAPPADTNPARVLADYQRDWNAAAAAAAENKAAEEATTGIFTPTYLRGVLIVNKTFGLPRDYGDGLTKKTRSAFEKMQKAADEKGLNIYISSGFRSYASQESIYDALVAQGGVAFADRDTARPGHSEHQSGLTFDLNSITESFGATPEGVWVRDNAYRYGFIVRYPQGKQDITGYIWEPWHLRYVGTTVAARLHASGQTLEEYLGVDSRYPDQATS